MLRGLEYVLSGYDIYQGNPSPTLARVDPGFRKRIFEEQYSEAFVPGRDGRFWLPFGVTAQGCEESCSLTSKVRFVDSTSTYRESLATRVSGGLEMLGIASFGASFDFQRVEQGIANRTMVYTAVETSCCAYRSYVATFSPPPATANFLAALDFAPVEYDEPSYFEIIAEFGTHFVVSADMGGLFGQETSFTREGFQRFSSNNLEWQVSARASFLDLIRVNMSAGTDQKRNETMEFRSFSSSQYVYSLGSRPPASGEPQDWLTSTVDHPMPTSIQLRPLSSLFNWRLASGIPDLNAKRANMERAVHEYCERVLLPLGRIRSCAASTRRRSTSGIGRVCLAPVWGGGGPNGQPFDDGAETLRANGLDGSLEMREVRYRAFRFVDGIQATVSASSRLYPLGQHGGTSGEPGSFAVPEGHRITSAQVNFGRYVDSLHLFTDAGTRHTLGGPEGHQRNTVNFRSAVSDMVGYVPRKAWLVGFFGRSGRYIDAIGFHVAFTCHNETPEVMPVFPN